MSNKKVHYPLLPIETPISAPAPTLTQSQEEAVSLSLCADTTMGIFAPQRVVFRLTSPRNEGFLRYKVLNTLTGEALKGRLAIQRDCSCFLLDFAPCRLNYGHYELALTIKGNVLRSQFGIVPTPTELSGGPIAVDYASAWHVEPEKREDYCHVLKLAGVEWVRERLELNEIYNDGKTYCFENYDHAFKLIKDAGMKITVCFHDLPAALCTPPRWMGSKMVEIYQFAKALAEHFAGAIDAWELWNEQDVTHFSGGTPDEYGAFAKAFALGLDAAGCSAYKLLGSYARTPDFSIYGDWMLGQDIMAYLDIYNFHTYVFPDKTSLPSLDTEATAAHMKNAATFNAPAWLTETGTIIARPDPDAKDLEDYQFARYVSVAGTQAAAQGASKIFHFMLPSYGEHGAHFGMFSSAFTPLPSAIALIASCNHLGACRILGPTTLPVHGYAVDTGGDEVLQLWADAPVTVTMPSMLPIVMADMNGGETCISPINGTVSLLVPLTPIFVHFMRIPASLYTAHTTTTLPAACKQLAMAQKVFLKANLPNECFPFFPNPTKGEGELVTTGYLLPQNTPITLALECCNFSNYEVSAYLCADCPNGVSLQTEHAVFAISAQSSTVISATLIATVPLSLARLSLHLCFDGPDERLDGSTTLLLLNTQP